MNTVVVLEVMCQGSIELASTSTSVFAKIFGMRASSNDKEGTQ